MLNPSGLRKIGRDLVARKMRTLLVTASIFIGVVGVITLFSMGEIQLATLERTVQQNKLAMLRAYVTLRQERVSDDATDPLETLTAQPGVEAVQGVALYPVFWRLPTDDTFSEARVFGYSTPMQVAPIETVELVNGRWPEVGQRELVVERRFANAHGIAPGDPLVLRVLSGGLHEETWTVTGTVFQPYPYPVLPGAPPQIAGSNMLFAQGEDVATITAMPGWKIIQARFTDYATADAQSDAFQATLAEQTPYINNITLLEDPAENTLLQYTRIFTDVINMLAVVALVVSGLLVFNVINATVIEERRQIGVMKALGVTGGESFALYAGTALVYGLIGVVPGVLLGIPAGYHTAKAIAPEFNIFLDEFAYSASAIVLGALLGVVVPVLSAMVPVLLGVRVSILEAMTDRGINASYGQGPLARLLERVPLPIPLHQALRNVLQKKGRLALTIVTLAMASGAFMGVYDALRALDAILENNLGQVGMHISVNPNGALDYDTLRDLVNADVPGLRAIEPGTTLAVDVAGYTPDQPGAGPDFMVGLGINPTNPFMTQFKLQSGRAWKDDPQRQGVVISANIAEGLGCKVGDSITLIAGGQSEPFEVLGITTYAFDMLWMPWQDLSRMGGLLADGPVPNEYVATVEVDGTPTTALGIDTQARLLLTFTAGDFLTPGEDGAIITTELATARGYAVGDEITVAGSSASRRVPITGIFNIPAGLLEPDQSREGVALFWQDLATLEGAASGGEPIPNELEIVVNKTQPTAADVAARIDAINEVLQANGISANYTNWIESTDAVTRQIDTAGLILNIAAALIGAVGANGLISALSMSVFERQKEIGVMRSIGATSNAIKAQFLVEGLIAGLIAWLCGIPASVLLKNELLAALNFDGVIGTEYQSTTLLVGLVATLLLAAGASLWPATAAARKTVSDILRYQ